MTAFPKSKMTTLTLTTMTTGRGGPRFRAPSRFATVPTKPETFFVGKDVALALGDSKPENAISTHVDIEDKTTTLIQGTGSNYKSKVVIINESGLYSLILSSKLPQAKAFKRWVTSEVLPQIRQTGG
ncbi:BRO domain protein [Xylanibacter ruminicola 23]|uniref:BRO domain protein n=2 Tax=Xylanibacter ruminicola TaxID=839 RepID=D5EVW1_XYLR2|nr:BRO domain protein [Xylanibacter ruminicola 23]